MINNNNIKVNKIVENMNKSLIKIIKIYYIGIRP